MIEDFEHCYRAVQSRDPRFDGWFFTAVTSTGIFCRPSCPARTPHRRHVRFYRSAAAAQLAGFRACLRCRPDAVPGSPEWDVRADVVARAMRLIADGFVDREGVAGLAGRLGYGARHLHRLLVAEVGAGPLALARAQRVKSARILIETTAVPMADVAFAAGFASVRQFNDTVRDALGRTPTELRERAVRPVAGRGAQRGAQWDAVPARGRARAGADWSGLPSVGALSLRLAARRPLAGAELLTFLGARAVPGVESFADGVYRRTLRLPHGDGAVALSPAPGHIDARLVLEDLRDLSAAVGRCRRLLDLDADPEAVDTLLAGDPAFRPLVTGVPGRRVPRSVNGFELAVRAVAGQQVSVTGARAVLGQLARLAGRPLRIAADGVVDGGSASMGGRTVPSRAFPSPEELLAAPDEAFAMPAARRATLRRLAEAVADGTLSLDADADAREAAARLGELRGVGPWTVAYVTMRALGDPDVLLFGDLGVRRGLERLGIDDAPGTLRARSERWRPWRSYATVHLWGAGEALDRHAGHAQLDRHEPETRASRAVTTPQAQEEGRPRQGDKRRPRHKEDAA